MSSEQVERLSNRQFVRREIRRISQASTTEEKIAFEEGLENYIVDKLNQLEASQQENERMFWLLDEARQCLRSVDKKEVFGFGQDGRTRWLLVDELLSKIDAALD